jgi:ribosomal protein S6--L-glutamate ligase
MILSFHPIFTADQNIICAGRKPNADDRLAIQAAEAVILPQGCTRSLYRLARQNCARVFPNYDARFNYPGKIGQIRLFEENQIDFPASRVFDSVDSFSNIYAGAFNTLPFSFPLLFKFNWGGEGESVFLIETAEYLQDILLKAHRFEGTDQMGFILQEYIPDTHKTLRVVVIGQKRVSYWRVQKNKECFQASLKKGATIDEHTDPELQKAAVSKTDAFCKKTKIDLAGFDFIFSADGEPLFLEINYFFGRRGLGGSEKFYQLLIEEITNWLSWQGLKIGC